MTKDESLQIVSSCGKFYVHSFIKVSGKFELHYIHGPFSDKEAKNFKKMGSNKRKRFRKRTAINMIKDGYCLDCKQKKSKSQMTFDHYRGDKKFDIASGPRVSWTKLSEEIEKCELVCRSCHNIREFLRGKMPLKKVEDLSELLSRYT